MTRRTRQPNSSPTTTSVAERRLMSQVLELQSTVEKLNSQVNILNEKVDNLEEQVKELSPLKNEVRKLADTNAVASVVSENLSKELERLQQYSRRNCLVLENIPLTKKESLQDLERKVESAVTKEFQIDKTEFKADFDKTHRIGPVRNNNQRVIVRFKRHSMVEKIYSQRKKSNKYNVKPSLTKFRLNTLNATLARFSKCDQVDFIYADVHGNLKVRFKEKFNGRYVYSFNDENELSELIHDVENSIYDNDINDTN